MARILVIDDDGPIRDVFATILRKAGYEVVTAGDGREAFRNSRPESFDVVVTDISMPEMDGIEVITRLREAKPRPHVIAMSGNFERELYLKMAGLLGAHHQLPKPVHPRELLEMVASLVGR
jgi:CheY-like chemotaxis protein